jgi:hypothetical protein
MVNLPKSILLTALLSTVVVLGACGKQSADAPKTSAQIEAERAQSAKTVRDNPVYGDQVKALDKAKATAAAAGEAARKTDDATKEPENPITKGY